MGFLSSLRCQTFTAMSCLLLLFPCFLQVVNSAPAYDTSLSSSLTKRATTAEIQTALQACLLSGRACYGSRPGLIASEFASSQVQAAFINDPKVNNKDFAQIRGARFAFVQLYNFVDTLKDYRTVDIISDSDWQHIASQFLMTTMRFKIGPVEWKKKIISANAHNQGSALYSLLESELDKRVVRILNKAIAKQPRHPTTNAAKSHSTQSSSYSHGASSGSSRQPTHQQSIPAGAQVRASSRYGVNPPQGHTDVPSSSLGLENTTQMQ
ncbi:hypothetical protein ABKN59_011240 [Abortiporus biennis]